MIKFFSKIISNIEKQKVGIVSILFAVFAISFLRNIFELLYKYGYIFGKQTVIQEFLSLNTIFVHFTSFWLAVFLVLSVLLYAFTFRKNTIRNTLKFSMYGMFIILFPVVFDMIIGNKDMMLYPNDPLDLFRNFKSYFNIKKQIYGLSPGMRYEVFIVTIFSGIYVYTKNKKWHLSILASLSTFAAITFFGLWISFLAQIYENGFAFSKEFLFTTSKIFADTTIVKFWAMIIPLVYIVLIILSLSFIFYKIDEKTFKSALKNLRITRTLHYLLLFWAGIFIAKIFFLQQNGLTENIKILDLLLYKGVFDYVSIFAGAISIAFAFQAAVIFNDINDYSIDQISNPKRPLVTDEISKNKYQKLAYFLTFFSLYLAYTIGIAFFLYVLTAIILSFIYSNNPLRLKKYFPANNFLIGLISLIVFHAGASLLLKDRSFILIPKNLTYVLLLGFTAVSTIKDLKDLKGDKKNGITTIATLLGKKIGKIAIGVLVTATIFAIPFVLELSYSLIISAVFALAFLLTFFYVKNNEKYIFSIYYLYMIIIFTQITLTLIT